MSHAAGGENLKKYQSILVAQKIISLCEARNPGNKLILHWAPTLITTLPKQRAVKMPHKVAHEIRKDPETSGKIMHSRFLYLPTRLAKLCNVKTGNGL